MQPDQTHWDCVASFVKFDTVRPTREGCNVMTVTVGAYAAQRECCVVHACAYGWRFTLSAGSCGSIKYLAEWIWGHLLWIKIQGEELSGANICDISLDLSLQTSHTDNKYGSEQAQGRGSETARWVTKQTGRELLFCQISIYGIWWIRPGLRFSEVTGWGSTPWTGVTIWT